MNPYLFVYGSLKSTRTDLFGQALRQRLAREATIMGPATIPGTLYDLGKYPGLVASDTKGAGPPHVHGELHRLTRPLAALRWLDAYEGIVPGQGREDEEYKRMERMVMLQQPLPEAPDAADTAGRPAGSPRLAVQKPRPVKAWVYLYRLDVSEAPQIATGIW